MLRTEKIYAKISSVFESACKVKAMSAWRLFKILLTSVAICKQRLLHENENVLNPQNYKDQGINQGHFRKPLRASTKAMKNNYPKTAHTFFTGRSIFSNILRVNCYNFRIALTKSIKLYFLVRKKYPVRNNSPLKGFKNYVFLKSIKDKALRWEKIFYGFIHMPSQLNAEQNCNNVMSANF